MTPGTWKLVNLETHIQQLLESAGLHSRGLVYLRKTKISRKARIIDITLTVLCARNSGTDQTTEANQRPSQDKPSSPKPSLEISSPNTLEPFRHTSVGTGGLTLSFERLETLQRLLEGKDGSLDVEMTHPRSGKLWRMTLDVRYPTS